MRLNDFDYQLPPERIAQTPLLPRDASRLLIDRGDTAAPIDGTIADLLGELRAGDLLVMNDTKVLPARLRLERPTGGRAEVLLLDALDGTRRRWEALIRPGKKLKPGEVLLPAGGDGTGVVRVGERTATGDTFIVELIGTVGAPDRDESAGRDDDPAMVDDLLDAFGEMPLPPYITERLEDADRYQTVYAERPASAAAPTAGLHFTSDLLERLADAGVRQARVELVVGLDTFRPIAVENPLDHRMHSERYRVPADTMQACRDTAASGGRVVAVGTTSVRALESAATTGDLSGRTELFIHRGYDWKVVDLMITNFHLPKTTLLMMIDAFVGDRWRALYEFALDHDYRFLSFGDAMLLDRSR